MYNVDVIANTNILHLQTSAAPNPVHQTMDWEAPYEACRLITFARKRKTVPYKGKHISKHISTLFRDSKQKN